MTDGSGRQRSLLSPTTVSPQLDRQSAPSRVSRSHLSAHSDVIAGLPVRHASNSGAETPPGVSPATSRRTGESSPRLASRTDVGLTTRTHKARQTVNCSPSTHRHQEPSPVNANYHATVAHLPADELLEDGFTATDLSDHISDDRCR